MSESGERTVSASKDLMSQAQILDAVRRVYTSIPVGAGAAMAGRFYAAEELARLPAAAVDWSLGVANPIAHADLRPGERVLDVGCGGGIDTVSAAHRVGPTGHVIGLDMLPEMCDRTRAAIAVAGTGAWCEVRLGQMEDIPLDDASIDVVVSNGVINLSPRKSRALAEMARVLVPGGRLCVSDLTVEGDLPPEILTSESAWAGCISGALSEDVFANKLAAVGFTDIELFDRVPFGIDDVALYPLFTPEIIELMRERLAEDRQRAVCTSLIARARKPLMSRTRAMKPPTLRP